jgi:hypothetical protein
VNLATTATMPAQHKLSSNPYAWNPVINTDPMMPRVKSAHLDATHTCTFDKGQTHTSNKSVTKSTVIDVFEIMLSTLTPAPSDGVWVGRQWRS